MLVTESCKLYHLGRNYSLMFRFRFRHFCVLVDSNFEV